MNSEEEAVVVCLFAQRPNWLSTGSLVLGELCRFESKHTSVEPLILDLDEITLYWGRWQNFFTGFNRSADVSASILIRNIEAILNGDLHRLIAYDGEGLWVGSDLMPPDEAHLRTAIVQFGPCVERVDIASWILGKR